MSIQQRNIIPLKWLVEDNYTVIMRFLCYDKSPEAVGLRTVLSALNGLWHYPHTEWQLAKEKLHIGIVGNVPGCGYASLSMGVAAQLKELLELKTIVILQLNGVELSYYHYYVDNEGVISLIREFTPPEPVNLSSFDTSNETITQHKQHYQQFISDLSIAAPNSEQETPISRRSTPFECKGDVTPISCRRKNISEPPSTKTCKSTKSYTFVEKKIAYAIASNSHYEEEQLVSFFKEIGIPPAINERYLATEKEIAKLEFEGINLTYLQMEEQELIDPMTVVASLGIDELRSRLVLDLAKPELILHCGGVNDPALMAGLFPAILTRFLEKDLFSSLATRINSLVTPVLALTNKARELVDLNSLILDFLHNSNPKEE